MAEIVLSALLRQTLALTLICTLLLTLRGTLRRHFGAGLAYASWALVPLVVLVGALPAQAPVREVVAPWVQQQVGSLGQVVPLAALNLPSHAFLWLALWATGAVFLLLVMSRQQWRLQRSLQREGEHWIGNDQGPALIGLWPARLLLPHDFAERFDTAQQPLVLAHEELHRRRFDNHWNALSAALLVLNWFNPAAWLAARALRTDQELACDAAVMARHPGCEADYARALLAAQRRTMGLALPWSHWTSSHPLVERITMLESSAIPLVRRRLGHALLASLALFGALGAQGLRAASDDTGPKIRLDMKLEAELHPDAGHIHQRISTLALVVTSGQSGRVIIGDWSDKPTPEHPQPDQVVAEFSPRVLSNGQVEIRFDISGGLPTPLSVKPRLITDDGAKARIEIGSTAGQPGLKIDVTPSVVRPG